MKSSKLWKLLSILDKKDIRELKKMVRSPFFNQREDVVLLLDILINALKDQSASLSKEETFSRVYSNEKFNVAQVHLISSILFKLIEQYLVWKERELEPMNDRIALAAAYRKRNLEDNFWRTIHEAKVYQEEQPLRNAEYHEKQYALLLEEFEFIIKTRKIEDNILQEIINHLDKSFISKTLRLELAINSHKAITNKEYESGILNLEEIPDEYTDSAINIYLNGYKAIKNDDEFSFNIFTKSLSNEVDKFPSNEQKDLFLMAINFCIRKFNSGNLKFAKIALEVYKNGLSNSIFIEDETLSRFTFTNIVSFASIVKEWDWAEEFVQEYYKYLEKQYREALYNFSLGRIYYERKNYDKALVYLSQTESKDVLISLNMKALQTKIYFEINEISLLQSHLNAFRIYITRHKEIGYHKEIYENFIKYVQKILNMNPKSIPLLNEISEVASQEKFLYEKKWLLEQIEKLKSKK